MQLNITPYFWRNKMPRKKKNATAAVEAPAPAPAPAEKPKKKRRPSVKIDVLRDAYLEVFKAEGTLSDLEAKLNVEPGSLNQNLCNLRKVLRTEHQVELPKLKRSARNGSRKSVVVAEFAETLKKLG
jgi:hypothetical protein